MSAEILVNITARETRVALVENGLLQEVYLQRAAREGVVGNIYNGVVQRVLPGMQAAFVDIGLERTAFLHASDIQRRVAIDGNGHSAEPKNGDDAVKEPPPLIQELVREGDSILVQVLKDPMGTKGARLTTYLSVPSRYMVMLPKSEQIGVSVRIEDEDERSRLKNVLQELVAKRPDGLQQGYIVRTAGEGVDEESLAADLAFLDKLWASISKKVSTTPRGQLVHSDLPLMLRVLRDLTDATVDKVRVDQPEAFDRICAFAEDFTPELVGKIERFEAERPIFDLFGVEDELNRALHRKAPLKSGGYLIIEQTEALTTIDVNTGGFVGRRNLEDTIFKTNVEATQAIGRQLRLRNLGGIIILDFIDMVDEEHKKQVLRSLEKILARDPAKTVVNEISPLGLVEMTRKRTRESLEHLLCEPCHTCGGRGSVKTVDTVCYEILREILRASRQLDAREVLVMAGEAVIDRLREEETAAVAELEAHLDTSIRLQADPQYQQEQFDVILL